jgi:glycosyltransferase involved in cell wall biosynthesis
MATEGNPTETEKMPLKKRVLFIVTQAEMGGAQRFILSLAESLDKERYEIKVASGAGFSAKNAGIIEPDYTLLDKLSAAGIKIVKLAKLQRSPNIFRDFESALEIKELIEDFEPDVLFLNSSKAGFIGSFTTKFLIDRKIKVIYRIGGWSFNDPGSSFKKWVWGRLEKLSARWKDIIIVNNSKDLELANKLGIKPKEKLVLIYNGIDPYKTEFMPRQEAKLRLFEIVAKKSGRIFQVEKIIGTVANFYQTKGLEYLIDSAEKFKDNPNIVFFIIGDGEQKQKLIDLIEKKGLQKKIYLLGQLSEAHKYIPAFDVFILSSLKEGFPWSLLEAMTAKVPVIATEVGAVPEMIEDGQSGFIIDPGNSEQLAQKISELLKSDYFQKEFPIRAHQNVIFRFELDKMVKAIESLL